MTHCDMSQERPHLQECVWQMWHLPVSPGSGVFLSQALVVTLQSSAQVHKLIDVVIEKPARRMQFSTIISI